MSWEISNPGDVRLKRRDRSGAFTFSVTLVCMMSDSTGASNLETWFSSERMSAYSFHPDPEALYVWNTRVTKCFLEDIQHVEVLLRNCVDKAVSPRYGEHWYNNSAIPFTREAKRAVMKALKRVGATKDKMPSSGQVIAELSFDFWAYLFTSNYSSTIWPLVRKTLVATPTAGIQSSRTSIFVPSLSVFKNEVDVAYRLRNRCAHHEPIIRKNRQEEESRLDRAQQAIETLSMWIDPNAAEWIAAHSRLFELRRNRP